MNYVFTFIGEFGYELFNWQGVVRKWSRENKKPGDRIIICSRKGMWPWYADFADDYYDILNIPAYKNSVADCYTGYIFVNGTNQYMPRKQWQIERTGVHINEIKETIINYFKPTESEPMKFIFSCDYQVMDGFHFGMGGPGGGSIYTNRLNLNNNEYVKVEIPEYETHKKLVESKIDLSTPYTLVQSAFRTGYDHKASTEIDHKSLFNNIEKRIIMIDFDSGRFNDSKSKFNGNFETYHCNSFEEQAVLITEADECVFTTVGDFRSHVYLPPMLGKDVTIIAPQDVWVLESSSIDFWNHNIFKFGGKMRKIVYEDLFIK